MKIEICTYSGKKLDIMAPERSAIDLYDIARGLSWLPRYRAQTRGLFAVAAHCVALSRWCEEHWPPGARRRAVALCALLHDAPEAYLGDIPYPVRPLVPDWKWYEDRLFEAIWGALVGLEPPTAQELEFVEAADRRIVGDEWAAMMPQHRGEAMPEPLGVTIAHSFGTQAMRQFYDRATELGIA